MNNTKPAEVMDEQEISQRTVHNTITILTREAALEAANNQMWNQGENSVHTTDVRVIAERVLGTVTWKSQTEGSRVCFGYRWNTTLGHVCRIYLDLFPMISCRNTGCRSVLEVKTERLREALAAAVPFYQTLWGVLQSTTSSGTSSYLSLQGSIGGESLSNGLLPFEGYKQEAFPPTEGKI